MGPRASTCSRLSFSSQKAGEWGLVSNKWAPVMELAWWTKSLWGKFNNCRQAILALYVSASALRHEIFFGYKECFCRIVFFFSDSPFSNGWRLGNLQTAATKRKWERNRGGRGWGGEVERKGREGKGLHKSSRASESLTLKHRAFLKKKNDLYLGAKLKSFWNFQFTPGPNTLE